ncbi:MAG TPA: DUF1707 domain-containing protein [Streptosporangiaceae bacterium]|nr:DUF1707 domain-containing protein [Streptosporangiaceae bacterium]
MRPHPEDPRAVTAGRRSHLRASHADREHVIDRLKAAFVQGRLTKDELDARVGQTLASRTYAELATVTADIPAGWIGDLLPGKPAGARSRPPVSKAATVARIAVVVSVALMAVAIFVPGGAALFLFTPIYCTALIIACAQILGSQHDGRPGRQLPGPSARGAGR